MRHNPNAFQLPPQCCRRGPFLMLSCRDPELLDQCTSDEHLVAGALGTTALFGAVVHAAGMAGALNVLNL